MQSSGVFFGYFFSSVSRNHSVCFAYQANQIHKGPDSIGDWRRFRLLFFLNVSLRCNVMEVVTGESSSATLYGAYSAGCAMTRESVQDRNVNQTNRPFFWLASYWSTCKYLFVLDDMATVPMISSISSSGLVG